MPNPTLQWDFVAHLASGHRLFRDTVSDRIAIADNSGTTPDQTEDGTIWLNVKEPAVLTTTGGRLDVSLSVYGPRCCKGAHVGVFAADIPVLHEHGISFALNKKATQLCDTWRHVLAVLEGAYDV